MEYLKNAGSVVMALALDKVTGSERIVIGEEFEVRARLEGRDGSCVLFDEKRPLGTFLFEHERQLDKDWNAGAIYPLKMALHSVLGRKQQEQEAWEFLSEKDNSHDPVCMFAASQCRRWYARYYSVLGSENNAAEFEAQIMGLTRSFKRNIWGADKNYSMDQVLERMAYYMAINCWESDVQARICYPGRKRNQEYLVIETSFIPAIWYYLNRLRDWGLCICRCVNCGKIFLAPSKHHSLCSDSCKKEKNRQNKREFDERARENKYDVDYKNTSQRMRGKLNRFRKRASADQLRQAEDAFEAFRKEAVRRKKQIRNPEDYKAFVDWLFEQERNFETICGR